jgi:acetate kinase
MFCYSVRKQLAAMIAVLEGADAIIFTGGIGESADKGRAAIRNGLSWTGVSLNDARNRAASSPISDASLRRAALVLPCREDEQIARHRRASIASADSDRG